MKIEITDLPNNQLIKTINLQMTFDDGDIKCVESSLETNKNEVSQTVEIPNEMKDIEF